jgi:hypothetical protein
MIRIGNTRMISCREVFLLCLIATGCSPVTTIGQLPYGSVAPYFTTVQATVTSLNTTSCSNDLSTGNCNSLTIKITGTNLFPGANGLLSGGRGDYDCTLSIASRTSATMSCSAINYAQGIYNVSVQNWGAIKSAWNRNTAFTISDYHTASSFFSSSTPAGFTDDWDPGNFIGNCPINTVAVGISTDSSGAAHSVECASVSGSVGALAVFDRTIFRGGANTQAYQRSGEWDPGYEKWECGLNDYISGVSNLQSNQYTGLHGIRCAHGNFSGNGTYNCEVRVVGTANSRGYTEDGNWAPGLNVTECGTSDNGQPKFMVGVSVAPIGYSTVHAILCCDQ